MTEANAPVPANRFELRRQRSRAALLDAAIELFQEKGIRATRLEEVCERADVALRTFFNHFETREHLYQAIGRQRAAQLAALIDAQRDDPRAFAERLLELFASIGGYVSARPAYRELVGEMLHLRLEAGNEVIRSGSLGRAALRFVADGVARDEVTRRHRPEVLADLLLGAITTALTNWSASGDYDLSAGLEQAAQALLDLFAVSTAELQTP
ncbi:MAG: TetR/AcrR family transcriptional regulator [Deltaproteobacteria bacterium]|nr:TetR/AcrR family transcriptional regulator [Deltaproteobacteria bacterium]MBW2362475.1 TetR/AcrR family transcriptional regulator [Deltaproteobacteria bacterium]